MGGYLKPGFILLLVIVFGNMIGKVAWTSLASSPRSAQKTDVIWIWTLTCLLPQFLLTLLVWFINLGLKTFKFLCLYPSYFLLSIFSPFMVSGDSDSGLKTVAISKMWTLVNFSLSVIGTIVGIYVYDLYSNGALADVGYFTFVLKSVAIFLFTFVLAAILLALFFCCSCCTCSMEKTGIDVNDFDKIIDLQTGQKYGADVESNTRRTGQVYDGANNDAHLIMLNERIQRNESIPSPSETDQECDDVNDEAIEAGSMIHPLESNAEETVDLDSPNLEEDLNIINGSVGDNDNPSETDQECVDANGEAIEAGSMIHPLASNIEKTVDLNSSDLEQDLEYVELNIINGSVGDNDNPDTESSNSNTDQLEPNPSNETDQVCDDVNDEAIEAGSMIHPLESNAEETVDLDSPNLEEDLNIINGSVGDNDNPSETDQECVDANGEAIEAGSMIHPLASNIEKTVDLNSSDLEQDLEYVELNIINGSVGDNDNLSDAELRNSNTDQLDPNPSETDQECIDANGEAIEAGSKTHLLECNAQSGSTYIDEEVEERDGDNDNLSDAELSNSNNGPINSLLLLAKQY